MSKIQVILYIAMSVLIFAYLVTSVIASFGVEWACGVVGMGGINHIPANCIKFFIGVGK